MLKDVKKTRQVVGGVAFFAWLASLALPAANFATPGYEYVPGGLVALVGLFFGWAMLQIGAYANLLFLPVIVVMLIGRRPWLAVVILIEIGALWSFSWPAFPDDVHSNEVQSFASGFYVWQVALALPLLARIWEWISLRSSRSLQPQP